jgi:hypothetical protein
LTATGIPRFANQNRDRVPGYPNVANQHSLALLSSMQAAPSEPPERSIQEYRRLQELDRARLPSPVNTPVDVQHTFRPPSQRPLDMLQSLERADIGQRLD